MTYTAGAGLDLTSNTFSVVADSAAGLNIDNTNGLQVVVDTTSIVFDGNGAVSAKIKANDALNVDASDGLNVRTDGVSVILNSSYQLAVGDVDFGEWS